ncbi:hypothetical protein ACL9RI_03770 [Janthinobacterium sp. Mn2066]|uniref:hypothetical protein n=1 Tax=Janthinobacterium sp. Mn2066 TaxID=3395264 RepID=UPI003BD08662
MTFWLEPGGGMAPSVIPESLRAFGLAWQPAQQAVPCFLDKNTSKIRHAFNHPGNYCFKSYIVDFQIPILNNFVFVCSTRRLTPARRQARASRCMLA